MCGGVRGVGCVCGGGVRCVWVCKWCRMGGGVRGVGCVGGVRGVGCVGGV